MIGRAATTDEGSVVPFASVTVACADGGAVTQALDALIFTPTFHQVAPGPEETTSLSLTTTSVMTP